MRLARAWRWYWLLLKLLLERLLQRLLPRNAMEAALKLDPFIRTELTGPWAGFGFQAGHLWTPENYTVSR